MTSHKGLLRLAVILLFVITFTAVGWAAPALYASHAPEGHFIEVHDFEAENVTTDAGEALICFDRTVKKAAPGEVFTELYLVDENTGEQRLEVGSDSMPRYFQQGHTAVVTSLDVPEQVEPGQYKYLLIIKMELVDGRVTRDFIYTSEQFTISETDQSPDTEFKCG